MCEILDIQYPVIQGPMAWITSSELVAAVSNAGDMNPPSGSFFYGMLQGDPDGGVNTVSNLASLIKSIDSCEQIVRELGAPFAE